MKKLWITQVCWMFAACSHATIEGTSAADTRENREIYEIVQQLRMAMERRDAGRIVSFLSKDYYEDMGTVKSDDDIGYDQMVPKVHDSMDRAKEVHVSFRVHDIQVEDERAYADVRYSSRTLMDFPAGAMWDTHKEFNRIKFVREADSWRVVSGL